MKRILCLISGLALTLAADTPVKMKDLPPAVQKSIQEQTKGLELRGLAKEVENGQTFYEAETRVNGHSKDFLFDTGGKLVEVEEEVAIDTIPAAARAAIEKYAAGGKITKTESVTKDGVVSYEAAVTKGKKKSEVAVSADGVVKK
ncbi:MAG: hypothetical protein M3O35_08155 [Acidobacteriota bacterium]|nr:hypothetical protein [Acidobacteriota bacterium]